MATADPQPPPVLDLDEILSKVPALKPFRGVIARLAGRVLRLDRFSADIADWAASDGYSATLDGLLKLHGVAVEVAHGDPAHLAHSGPLIVVANHPLGVLDAMAITALGERQGRPPRILASNMLGRIGPVRKHLIAVDNFSATRVASANAASLRAAAKHLGEGGAIVAFPASRVSHFSFATMSVQDRPWSEHIYRLARMTGATVLPVRVHERNSFGFYAIGLPHFGIRTVMLLRQMYRLIDGRARVTLSIGEPVPPEDLAGDEPRIADAERLRALVYALPG